MKIIMTAILAIITASASQTAYADWSRMKTDSIDAWVYRPASKPRSVMLNLHGCTQHASDLKERGNWERSAEDYGMVVVIPEVPNGGVVMGCWDYYGMDHTDHNRHNGPLIELTKKILADTEIATANVSGLSSGAGEAMVLGCLRPDLFQGVGLNASPAVGTEMGEISTPRASSEDIAHNCRQLAGKYAAALATQKTSIIHGDQDFIVSLKHSALIEGALIKLYHLKEAPEQLEPSDFQGSFTDGQGRIYKDVSGSSRVSLYANNGLGHAWPAGSGGGFTQKYINPQSVSYPAYLGKFFERDESGDRP